MTGEKWLLLRRRKLENELGGITISHPGRMKGFK